MVLASVKAPAQGHRLELFKPHTSYLVYAVSIYMQHNFMSEIFKADVTCEAEM